MATLKDVSAKLKTGVTKTAKDRVENLSKSVKKAVSPKNLASKGFRRVRSKLTSELPELGALTDSLGSFVKDFKRNFDKGEDTNRNIKQIKTETEDQTSLLSQLIKWMQQIDSNLHGSPPYLLTIREEMEELNASVNTLIDITGNVWGVAQEQVEITKALHKEQKDAHKRARFEEQKKSSKITPAKEKAKEKKEDKKQKSFLDMLLGGAFLARLAAGIGAALGGIISAIGGAALAGSALRKLGLGRNIPKGAKPPKKQKLPKDNPKKRSLLEDKKKRESKFKQQEPLRDEKGRFTTQEKLDAEKKAADKKAGTKGSKKSKFSKVAKKFAKPALKTAGKVGKFLIKRAALPIAAGFGLYGAGKGALEGLREGKDAKGVAGEALKGAFEQTVGLSVDQLSNFLTTVKNSLQPAIDNIVSVFNSLKSAGTDLVTTLKQKAFELSETAPVKMIDKFGDKINEHIVKPAADKIVQTIKGSDAKQTRKAIELRRAQQAIQEHSFNNKNVPQSQGMSAVNAMPITQNIQTNNIIPGNIITRNPESPVDKSSALVSFY